ncbi:hypothetical protein SAMD00019534_053450 [Acytostelium subglobosum LB1]|uniref:hypothetical protein n=1 Tax=Acytostelium subglobosum LB1 TaxID=1410327 RepID=UPI000644AFC2|nr:hypothetical protein SAMD00019534_053450 [Acytostelium subglobosum LB1]GAM22170.1 hypothetical protein SAMD00019534_053450 [Acytostelium subglobosum LB1]|eukprot:XP_012755270.1 hypothetical protein SAMD00019534_053450 [Acytostelium subglobosum LB1]
MMPMTPEVMKKQAEEAELMHKLIDLSGGAVQKSRALVAAARLNIAAAIGAEPKSCEKLALEVGCDEECLYRLMRALSQIGIFKETEESRVFENTRLSTALAQDNFRDLVMMTGLSCNYRAWEVFPETVKRGKSDLTEVLGGIPTIWQFLKTRPEDEMVFGKAMSALTNKLTPMLVAQSDFTKFDTVCDLGGSQGTFISAILRANPTIKEGINFDLPTVIEKNKLNEARNKQLDPRFKEVGGDFFKEVPAADCYVLKNTLHDWNDECSVKILKSIASAMKPGAKIYVYDFLLSNEKNENLSSVVWMDLNMLQLCNGKERTLANWEHISVETGLKIERVQRAPKENMTSLVIFTK